jgi:hypothetical protein
MDFLIEPKVVCQEVPQPSNGGSSTILPLAN